MRRLLPLVLCASLLLGGCQGTRVNVMGFDLEHNPPVKADFEELDREDKVGVIVILAVLIGGSIWAAQ